MNHGIARVMDLSIGLHVTSKSGGGGGGALKNPFPVIAYSVAYFRPHPSHLSRFFFLTTFFSYLKIPKTYDPILWKIQPIIVNPVTKKRPHPAVHPHRPFIRKHPPALGRTKQKNFRESINHHWFTFAATFHGKAEVVPPTLAGAGTYLFRLSVYGFRWSRIRVIIKKKKKEKEKKNGVQSYLLVFCCVMRM